MRAKQISFHKLLRNYLYIRRCPHISILSVYVSRHRHTSATSLFIFKLRYSHVFLLILRYLRDVERGSEESEESEESEKHETLTPFESNRIESNRVAFRGVESGTRKKRRAYASCTRFSARVENTRKSIEVVVFPVERRELFSQSRTIATPFPT